ncbi:beta-ketoacyl-ACP synthase III [Thermocrispum municipale]|uniref:beta-ketoacyl-ACP synthase III n=1 Tax=Thermocrispum municipale TaxID=37926 RepID=UPI00048F1556|nr:beta-ketoacyl-ACP synthase III [Thermocrispum municipale]
MRITQGSRAARMIGVGAYVPEGVVDNDELAARFGKPAEWFESRTGMSTRARAGAMTLTEMAVRAGAAALTDAKVEPEQIDLVITATCSADAPIPAVAFEVIRDLEIKSAAAFDLNTACSGFCYSLTVANDLIRAGTAHTVLVTAAEQMTAITDPTDLGTSVVFGDGAGAAVVTGSNEPGIGPVVWGSDASGADLIVQDPSDRFLRMQGQKVFRWATTEIHPVALSACQQAGVDPSELAAVVPHQANLRIVDALANKIGATNAVVARDGAETGNTSAASIPLALRRLMDSGQVSTGDLALLVGFGAGLSYAAQVIRVP